MLSRLTWQLRLNSLGQALSFCSLRKVIMGRLKKIGPIKLAVEGAQGMKPEG